MGNVLVIDARTGRCVRVIEVKPKHNRSSSRLLRAQRRQEQNVLPLSLACELVSVANRHAAGRK